MRIIAGQFKGRFLKAPKVASTRPTQGMLREAVFNICQNQVEGARFLDLYAGSGAMAFEALSRGAGSATLVEQNRHACAAIKENLAQFHLESKVHLIATDVKRALHLLIKQAAQFDLIYIDPPYDTPLDALLTQLEPLLAPGATLFVEERQSGKKHQPPSFLHLKSTRRFGVASFHQYQFFA